MRFEIVTYGNPILRRKAVPVEKIDRRIKLIADDMLETMYESKGLGLAAEQVGKTISLCVIDVPKDFEKPIVAMPLIMINPKILSLKGMVPEKEGCLSFPGIFVPIKRAAEATVRFLDLKSREQTVCATGWLARVVQHELDHLNGKLLVDRMSPVSKLRMARQLRRLRKETVSRLG